MHTPSSRRCAWQLACAALLTAASLPAYAAAEQAGETITIEGEQLPDCAVDVGLGYVESFNLDGSFAGCVCADAFYCGGAGPEYPGGGGPEYPGGGGGGGAPDDEPEEEPEQPDDECADGGCTCEEQETEPEWCTLPNCLECDMQMAGCYAAANLDARTCWKENQQIAVMVCLGSLNGAPDFETCVARELYGIGWTASNGQVIGQGQTDGYTGGVKWDWGSFGINTSSTTSSSSSTGISTNVPFKEPDRDTYRDCHAELRDGVDECTETHNQCKENAEGGGESCDQDG